VYLSERPNIDNFIIFVWKYTEKITSLILDKCVIVKPSLFRNQHFISNIASNMGIPTHSKIMLVWGFFLLLFSNKNAQFIISIDKRVACFGCALQI